MADRIELNAQDVEDINGGAVNFFTNHSGQPRVNITNMGNFDTTTDGFFKYVEMRNGNPGLTEAEYVQMGFAQGIFW